MVFISSMKPKSLLPWLSLATTVLANTGTIQDVEHVVLFMQENRAFDHYFGTMPGVRGFADPNIHIAEDGTPIWFQSVTPDMTSATTHLMPFYLNEAGGTTNLKTQCMLAGGNGFTENHKAFAQGDNNQWAIGNSPYSLGYFKRQDIPTHFALAEGWTVGDMYAEGVVASTLPNRAYWASGSVNVPGGPQTPDQGGVVIDNNETPGCEGPNLNCFPYKWKTYAEFLEEGGISWQVFQDTDNFDDNPLAWFGQFMTAPSDSGLAQRGLSFLGLDAFYNAAAAGTLPNVSFIIGPMELSEHATATPSDGAWLQQQIANAVIHSPKYNATILFISYDETGGWADHVLPIFAPKDTPGEWMTNPFNTSETVFAGPGFRLPFTAISPWSRGGHVFTAHSDHSSQIMFMEEWLTAKGQPVVTDQLNSWRRDHMSDLTQMFDFANPDFTIPDLPVPTPPLTNALGQYLGSTPCLTEFPNPQPDIPYGQQTREKSLVIEDGFKSVRGALTEGRYLVFESGGFALSFSSLLGKGLLGVDKAVPAHDKDQHRFILHATAPPPATTFNLQFAGSPSRGFVDGNNLETSSISQAAEFNITDLGNGKGYTIQQISGGLGEVLSIVGGVLSIVPIAGPDTFKVFSVTKSTDSGTGFV